ncbi:unnamed protein product, partial [Effrenium voratum]
VPPAPATPQPRPQPSRSWQPGSAQSPRLWPNKEQQEQIERLTRQVHELKQQQQRHQQEWAQIPAAALGKPCEEPTTLDPKAKEHLEKVLSDLPTACRNARKQGEVNLASPRQSISSSQLRDAMGTYGLPAPPTPPVQRREDDSSSVIHLSPSPQGTSPPEPRSFVLGQARLAARTASVRDDGRGSPHESPCPPSPPRAENCSTRLRLTERLDMAQGSITTSVGNSSTECPG